MNPDDEMKPGQWRCGCGETGDDAEGYDRGCNTHACPMRPEGYVYVADRPVNGPVQENADV